MTRIKVWEYHEEKLDFWQEGRVEMHKLAHEDYKVKLSLFSQF